MPADINRPPYDTAIVTGGAGTLGSAICRALAETGYRRIAIVDRDIEKSNQVAAELKASFSSIETSCIPVDLTKPDAPRDIVEPLIQNGRRITAVINNAAAKGPGGAGEIKREVFDFAMMMNVTVPMFLVQAAIPHWKETGAGGYVVNITSRAWLAGTSVSYSASKAGLVGLTYALASELGQFGVCVNGVGPSYVRSPFNNTAGRSNEELLEIEERQKRMSFLKRLAEPEDIADAVAFLASHKASFITGEIIYVAGGGQLAQNTSAFS